MKSLLESVGVSPLNLSGTGAVPYRLLASHLSHSPTTDLFRDGFSRSVGTAPARMKTHSNGRMQTAWTDHQRASVNLLANHTNLRTSFQAEEIQVSGSLSCKSGGGWVCLFICFYVQYIFSNDKTKNTFKKEKQNPSPQKM